MITRRGLLGGLGLTPLARHRPKREDYRMTTYIPCAGSPVSLTATADTTGLNSGNLTNAFTVNILGTTPPVWEWYHAVVSPPQPGQTLTPAQCIVLVNKLKPVTFTFPVGGSDYDPSQPVAFRQGDELFFLWQLASSTAVKPVVTMYLRFDADIPANVSFLRGA